jgi:excisionase family DNA binding protein
VTDDEVRALALLLRPYRAKVEAMWAAGATRPDMPSEAAAGLLTVPQAAERIGCSRGHVYNLVAAGKLQRYDIALKGSKVRLSDQDVTRFINDARSAVR